MASVSLYVRCSLLLALVLLLVFPIRESAAAREDDDDEDIDEEEDDDDVRAARRRREAAKARMEQMQQMPKFDPKNFNPQAIFDAQRNKPQMTFATLKFEYEEKEKQETEKIAVRWRSMLEMGHIQVQAYAVDPGKILLMTQNADQADKVREFALAQRETDWFEINRKRFFPGRQQHG